MTRLESLQAEAKGHGLAVHTWSPGDGVTRYRFFRLPEAKGQTYFGPANGIYTALGFKEAQTFLDGVALATQ